MKKTYIFRRYTQRPRLFTEMGIPAVGSRNQLELSHSNSGDFFINDSFIQQHNIESFTIHSHKQVTRSKLYVRSPSGEYTVPDFFQESIINFFITNGSDSFKNCYISATKVGFNQLVSQANHSRLDAPYLLLQNSNLNLVSIITRFDPIHLKGIGFSISGNPNIKSIKLKGNQSVTDSREAQQAINDGGIIKYFEFTYGDTNVTLYDDFTFSFYSDLDYESDIVMINQIIEDFNLLN